MTMWGDQKNSENNVKVLKSLTSFDFWVRIVQFLLTSASTLDRGIEQSTAIKVVGIYQEKIRFT